MTPRIEITFFGIFIFRLAIGNKSDPASVGQMDFISIFLHERGKFLYFKEVKTMPNNVQITDMLKYVFIQKVPHLCNNSIL